MRLSRVRNAGEHSVVGLALRWFAGSVVPVVRPLWVREHRPGRAGYASRPASSSAPCGHWEPAIWGSPPRSCTVEKLPRTRAGRLGFGARLILENSTACQESMPFVLPRFWWAWVCPCLCGGVSGSAVSAFAFVVGVCSSVVCLFSSPVGRGAFL